MKHALLTIGALIALSSTAHAKETVIDRCEGYIPAYFAELIKIENGRQVEYQVNLMGTVTSFNSAKDAQSKFNEDCGTVRSWE
jgi:hypothetical protein